MGSNQAKISLIIYIANEDLTKITVLPMISVCIFKRIIIRRN